MSKATNTTAKRTANDTATREELASIQSMTTTASETFVSAARERVGGFFREAAAYVAAVDAHGGKRGADATVRKAIDAAVTSAGFVPYSQSRYSNLSGAYRAIGAAKFDVATPEAFDALYALTNLSASKMTADARADVIKAAARRQSDETRLAFIIAATAKANAPKSPEDAPKSPESTEDNDGDNGDNADTLPATEPATAEDVMDAIATIYAVAGTFSEADRIRVAEAFRASAEALTASVVPADVSALTEA